MVTNPSTKPAVDMNDKNQEGVSEGLEIEKIRMARRVRMAPIPVVLTARVSEA